MTLGDISGTRGGGEGRVGQSSEAVRDRASRNEQTEENDPVPNDMILPNKLDKAGK